MCNPDENERKNPMHDNNKTSSPLFPLGQTVATKGALAVCSEAHMAACLCRHQCGDWGRVCEEDAASNDAAVKNGGIILSAYPVDPAQPCKGYGANCLWIITEGDRSVTTFLLPDEY
jgi:hypothetical protein